MTKQYTTDEFNTILDKEGKNMRVIGEYTGAHSRATFECLACYHRWTTKAKRMRAVNGTCPNCIKINQRVATTDRFKEFLKNNIPTITMTGAGVELDGKVNLSCSECNHKWRPTIKNVVNHGSECPSCKGVVRLTKDSVNKHLEATGRTVRMIGKCHSALMNTEFKCLTCDNIWLARPTNVKNLNRGCPCCAKYGYNPGKPGYIYVLDFGDFIKFGITNDLTRRLSEHKRSSIFETVTTYYSHDGTIPVLWESKVKEVFGGNFVNRTRLQSGWTETLSPVHLSQLLLLTTEYCDTILPKELTE